ncbi:MAG: CCA tRNA nucleotidyltransferase [Pseudomonadota bacterium]
MQERRLAPQPWMNDPRTKAVIRALTADGAEVRFVGGCVRDAVIGRPVKDIDLATPDPPETVMALVQRAGLKVVPTGVAHGTVTAIAEGHPFEVTTLRRDVETYGRRAKVEFTDDWVEDAARRDLTFNAMSLSPDGTLHDPFGGLADLEAGRVRFVGDAETRIEEDVLRLLRFFRFYAHYGKPPPDEAALAACRKLAPKLPGLSGERVQAETLKLLAAPDPASVIHLMREQNVLAYALPEADGTARLAALAKIEAALERDADPVLRLSALIEGGPKAALGLAQRLKLSNADRDRIVGLAEPPGLAPALDDKARRLELYRRGPKRFRDAALLAWAAVLGAGEVTATDARWRALAAVAETPAPAFPLQGRDALKLGVPAGRRVGELLKEVERWWIEGDFSADRKACLAELRKRVRA